MREVLPTQHRPIGFWLRLVDGLLEARLAETLGEGGIGRRHWQVLNVLQQGSADVADVDGRVRPFLTGESATTLPVLEALVGRGWVTQANGIYELTDAGQRALDALLSVVSVQRRRLTEGISEAEYATAVSVLERMARNLGWSGRDD